MAPGAEREVPPFSLTEPRYDQSTFLGRTRLLYELTDARTLLKSSEEISQAKTLLDEYAAGRTPQTVSDSDLWAARSLTESALHPDTGEELPRPFRFAAFGPVNVPICAAMLVPNASASWTAGVQLVNQVFNVAVNYSNRNASSDMSTTKLVTAGSVAAFSACALALSVRSVGSRFQGSALLRTAVPYTAVVGAGITNLVLIRQSELVDGVAVFDATGEERGMSVTAGQAGIRKCAIARAVWSLPPLLIPPMVMARLGKIPTLKKNPRAAMLTELVILSLAIWAFLPPALAVFPQRANILAIELEPQFQGLVDKNGDEVTTFSYNKGL